MNNSLHIICQLKAIRQTVKTFFLDSVEMEEKSVAFVVFIKRGSVWLKVLGDNTKVKLNKIYNASIGAWK